MKCDNVRKSLVEYVEDVLASRKRLKIESHLSQCESCRSELSQIRNLREDIASLEEPERDAEFWDSFNKNLSRRLKDELEPPSRRVSWIPKLVTVMAAGTILIVLSFLAFTRLRQWPSTFNKSVVNTNNVQPGGSAGYDSDFSDDDIAVFALADLSNEEIEEAADGMGIFVGEELLSESDEVALDAIYEQSIYDIFDGLAPDEYAEVYQDLGSI